VEEHEGKVINRRTFGRSVATLALGGVAATITESVAHPLNPASGVGSPRVLAAIKDLEYRSGSRLGVVAVDTGSGDRIGYRANELFPMCSTSKFLTAAAILSLVDQGHLTLDQHVAYGPADLLAYAPVTRKNVAHGFMTVEALGEAAVRYSDNTAANLLVGVLGGTGAWTRFARSINDPASRMDRIEPALNTAIDGDPRDTSTPAAMARNLATVILGRSLADGSRNCLTNWMLDSPITGKLLRARLHSSWRVADKSGSGDNGTRNDVGVLFPPSQAPLLVAICCTGSRLSEPLRDGIIANAGSIVAVALGHPAGKALALAKEKAHAFPIFV
jgi:beta-lactamase class A